MAENQRRNNTRPREMNAILQARQTPSEGNLNPGPKTAPKGINYTKVGLTECTKLNLCDDGCRACQPGKYQSESPKDGGPGQTKVQHTANQTSTVFYTDKPSTRRRLTHHRAAEPSSLTDQVLFSESPLMPRQKQQGSEGHYAQNEAPNRLEVTGGSLQPLESPDRYSDMKVSPDKVLHASSSGHQRRFHSRSAEGHRKIESPPSSYPGNDY